MNLLKVHYLALFGIKTFNMFCGIKSGSNFSRVINAATNNFVEKDIHFKIYLSSFYVHECLATCTLVYSCCSVPVEVRREHRCPGTELQMAVSVHRGCWKLDSDPL